MSELADTQCLQARAAITDQLHRYCRGLDRWDREVLLAVFHADATVQYPPFSGTREDLVAFMWQTHATYDMHSHQMANIIVELDDGRTTAVSESYVTASLWRFANREEGGGPVTNGLGRTDRGELHVLWARYFDRWALRGGRWAIAHRRCVVDIKTQTDGVGALGEGRRDHADASYDFLRTPLPMAGVADRGSR